MCLLYLVLNISVLGNSNRICFEFSRAQRETSLECLLVVEDTFPLSSILVYLIPYTILKYVFILSLEIIMG